MPSITVWPHRAIVGWDNGSWTTPLRGDSPVQSMPVVDLQAACAQSWPTDAHFVPYHVNGEAQCPRVNGPALALLRRAHKRLVYDVIALDVDAPGHGTAVDVPAWCAETLQRVPPVLLATAGAYTTRGGMRLLWTLPANTGPDAYVAKHAALRAYLRTHGVEVDEQTGDFGRCYRLPLVVRDGQPTTSHVRLDTLAELPDIPGLRGVPSDARRLFQAPALPDWVQTELGRAGEAQILDFGTPRFSLPLHVPSGARNETLVRIAGFARQHGADMALTRGIVDLYVGAGIVENPETLTRDEIDRLLNSATQWTPGTPSDRESIRWAETRLGPIAERCAELLGRNGVFQRGSTLVRIGRDDNDGLAVQGLKPNALAPEIGRIVELIKRKANGEEYELAPPPRLCNTLHDSPALWGGLARLKGLSDCPVLRSDGTVAQHTGFDALSGFYVDTGGQAWPDLPEQPTHTDAVSALAYVRSVVLGHYTFERPEHESTALAIPLTTIGRTLYDGPSPLFLIDASAKGSGKSLLASAWAVVTTGKPAAVSSLARTEECEKYITTVLRDAAQIVCFDDVKHEIGSEGVLDRVITCDVWQGRLLGKSERVTVPNRTTWIATGNNVRVAGDLQRRSLLCRLDPGVERPWERQGLPDLRATCKRERTRLVVALLTVLRAYVLAGYPQYDVPAFGSFEDWARVVRGVLLWCGMPDPCATTREIAERADFAGNARETFLSAFAAHFGNRAVTSRDIMRTCLADAQNDTVADMRDALTALGAYNDAGHTNAVQIGKALSRFAGTISQGRRFERRKRGGTWVFIFPNFVGNGEDERPSSPHLPLRGSNDSA